MKPPTGPLPASVCTTEFHVSCCLHHHLSLHWHCSQLWGVVASLVPVLLSAVPDQRQQVVAEVLQTHLVLHILTLEQIQQMTQEGVSRIQQDQGTVLECSTHSTVVCNLCGTNLTKPTRKQRISKLAAPVRNQLPGRPHGAAGPGR